jgi:hypothetical protein
MILGQDTRSGIASQLSSVLRHPLHKEIHLLKLDSGKRVPWQPTEMGKFTTDINSFKLNAKKTSTRSR